MQQHERAKEYEDNRVPFTYADELIPMQTAERIVQEAMQRWQAPDHHTAEFYHSTLLNEFPNTAKPDSFWHEASEFGFRDFFPGVMIMILVLDSEEAALWGAVI